MQQLTVEWHHYTHDTRYGGGASPELNAVVQQLAECGLRQYWVHDDEGGWPSTKKVFSDMGMEARRASRARPALP